MQMDKLENMYIVLSAEDGMSKFKNFEWLCEIDFGKQIDEWERDFQKLRADVRDIKDSIKKRSEALENSD